MIIQKLLALESEAQEAMNAIAKEKTRLAQKAEEDLSQRIAEIEQNADVTIEQLLAEADASERIEEIKTDYKGKEKVLEESFSANNRKWRERILYNVLYEISRTPS